MGVSYEVDPDRALVCIEFFGTSGISEVYEVLDRVAADPRVGPGTSMISDHTRETTVADTTTLSPLLPRFADFMRKLESNRCALVSTNPAQLGAMNLFAAHADLHGFDVRVFRSRTEAEDWLAKKRGETGD